MSQARLLVWMIVVAFSLEAKLLDGQEVRFPELLIEELDRIDLDGLSPQHQIQTYLTISAQLNTVGRQELAEVLLVDAMDVARLSENPIHYSSIAEHAIATSQFEIAEELIEKSGFSKKWLPKRLVAAKIRSGNLAAFDKQQFNVTDFHTALDISAALMEIGKVEAACDFVSDLVFEANDGNDPKDAQSIVYRNIAMHFYEKGDQEQARRYIDKAIATGGKLFYTGYTLQVDQRVIYDELTIDRDKFAKQGAAYQGHMGDELVAGYARALYNAGKYDDARQVIEFISTEEDREYSRMTLAIAQAKKGELNRAEDSIKNLKLPARQFQANVHLAIAMMKAEKNAEVDALLRRLDRQLNDGLDSDKGSLGRFAYLLGYRKDWPAVRELLRPVRDELTKANLLTNAFKGMAKAEMY